MSEVKEVGKATDEQIAKWKAEHRCPIFEVSLQVNDEDELEKIMGFFYLKKPDRNVSSAAAKHIKADNFLKGNSLLINSCVVGGAKEYLQEREDDKDDSVYFAVLDAIGELASKKEREIKKR